MTASIAIKFKDLSPQARAAVRLQVGTDLDDEQPARVVFDVEPVRPSIEPSLSQVLHEFGHKFDHVSDDELYAAIDEAIVEVRAERRMRRESSPK